MVYEPKSPPSKFPPFSESGGDGTEAGINLGLELGLGTNYKEKVDRSKRKEMEEEVSMGFTFMQRIELEQQSCIFKYIQSGLQVPYPLFYPLWKSVAGSIDCAAQCSFIPNLYGGAVGRSWMGSTDPEPGRCKRTDGKKWRCAKEALRDSKYCDKHLHRGRHRSRKHVESSSSVTSTTSVDVGTNTHFPPHGIIGQKINDQ